jgi:hypothetical protein
MSTLYGSRGFVPTAVATNALKYITLFTKDNSVIDVIKGNQLITRSRDSSVGIAMGYGLGDCDAIPGRDWRVFCTPQLSDRLWSPTQPLIKWVPKPVSLGIKRLEHEADPLPASIAKVKNGGALAPLPHMSS